MERKDAPGLHKDLLCPVRSAGSCCGTDVCSEFFESLIVAEGHSSESASSLESILAGSDGMGRCSIHVVAHVVVRGRVAEEHGHVFGFAG